MDSRTVCPSYERVVCGHTIHVSIGSRPLQLAAIVSFTDVSAAASSKSLPARSPARSYRSIPPSLFDSSRVPWWPPSRPRWACTRRCTARRLRRPPPLPRPPPCLTPIDPTQRPRPCDRWPSERRVTADRGEAGPRLLLAVAYAQLGLRPTRCAKERAPWRSCPCPATRMTALGSR